MSIERHPALENLVSCSAGSMPEALAAVMASHISLCKRCRRELAIMETIGASLIDEVPSASLTSGIGILKDSKEPKALASGEGDVPAALRKHVGPWLKDVPWKWAGFGVWQHRIPLSGRAKASLRLIRVSPGLKLPDHGHSGSEMTLVLRGFFTDNTGSYGVGDVADMNEGDEHAPIAGLGDDCICLVASEGPMRFNSILDRVLQKLTGFD
ncbi:ChrR family anti-sigma-E factor [Hyphomicrobium sp.]|uniref:ChrR family anti-sigma-E factor n=1 Tax=Hyphomicrobium sp. TaxID=82 RepID=UPI001D5BA576|nr:ChrR family anti-sigma-E factor [Hyphomicrobium sp.]MBY0559768.1 ChrR family anti-sigma-E factor [Hyphomicrobium sp.]